MLVITECTIHQIWRFVMMAFAISTADKQHFFRRGMECAEKMFGELLFGNSDAFFISFFHIRARG